MSPIQTYFLRVYAIERQKRDKDETAAYREALFQTRFLVFLPAVGLGSAAIVVVGRLSSSGAAVLSEYRTAITVAAVGCLLFASFLLVRHAIRKLDDIPAIAERYRSPRDRRIPHIQFWCTLLLSLSFPFVVALI
jgi:hypothetical protein